MKQIKNMLLMMALVLISANGFAQFLGPIVYNVDRNGCVYSDSNANNYTITNTIILSNPQLGTMNVAPALGGAFIYCSTGAIGQDTVKIYGCVSSNVITFPICDSFYVIFNITNGGGCNLSVTLTQDSGICIGGNRHYQATVSGGTGAYTYIWNDLTTQSGACELNPGQGTCVSVTDANGCVGSACTNPNGCVLSINVLSGPCAGPLPSLQGIVTGGVLPYTYTWTDASTQTIVAGGVDSTGNFMIACNLTQGTYYLNVTDANGCGGTIAADVGGTGNCSFTYTQSPLLLANVVDFYSYNDSSLMATEWRWIFGDGGSDTVQNPTHTFPTDPFGRDYYVTMNVYYSNGDSCSFSQYIYVQGDSSNTLGCQAYFYNYLDSSGNGTYQFVDYSAYNPTSWSWDFGDNTSSTLQNPTHTYNTIGTWTVCLTTTDANGCSSNYCAQLSNVPVQDVEAFLYHQTTVTPGFPVWVYLSYYNAGTILMNGTVEYRYPAGTTVNATSVVPASHDVANRLLTFNYSNLLPGSSDYIQVDLDASAVLTLGSLVDDTLWVNPITGDLTPANNISVVTDSVVGSWDPNDKAVSPKGLGETGNVDLGTKELSYRIRFQNTGSAPAQKVVVRDVISNNIDLSSVKVTDASHAHTVEIIGNELVVTFANINLPDSGANYAASQGFINIYAKLKSGLSNGIQIFNTAEIYFDFNAAVITNTVLTTLGSTVSGIDAVQNFDFAVVPNPASNVVSLRGEFEKGATYEMLNPLGQIVLRGEIKSNNTTLNIAELNAGIYLVKVTNAGKTGVQRLLVAK